MTLFFSSFFDCLLVAEDNLDFTLFFFLTVVRKSVLMITFSQMMNNVDFFCEHQKQNVKIPKTHDIRKGNAISA